MTLLLAVSLIMASVLLAYSRICLRDSEAKTQRFRELWQDTLSERGSEDALIYEWSNRDLMPGWEDAYPHVKDMPASRKYSEWATFCANYPTREQLIAQISLDGAYHRARTGSE